MLELSPIIKSLWRSKIGPLLIVVQLALSIAIVSNSVFFIQERVAEVQRPTGLDYQHTAKIWVKNVGDEMPLQQMIAADIAALSALPGVREVAALTEGVPFSHSGGSSGFSLLPDGAPERVSVPGGRIEADHRIVDALGLQLLSGRSFYPEETIFYSRANTPDSAMAIITESLGREVFGDKDPVNKTLFMGKFPLTVVGVVEDFLGYSPGWNFAYNNVLISGLEDKAAVNYVIRSHDDSIDSLLLAATAALQSVNPVRIIQDEKTMQSMMRHSYQDAYAMIILLSVVIALLVFINMLGIVGITTFWVNQRRKQIGIRRALGATRLAITRYFLVENTVLVMAAIILGAMMALWFSHTLVKHYSAELLPWWYVPAAGTGVLVVTLLAALIPARRAALISPCEAVANR